MRFMESTSVPFDIEAVVPVFCKVENTFETIAVTYQL